MERVELPMRLNSSATSSPLPQHERLPNTFSTVVRLRWIRPVVRQAKMSVYLSRSNLQFILGVEVIVMFSSSYPAPASRRRPMQAYSMLRGAAAPPDMVPKLFRSLPEPNAIMLHDPQLAIRSSFLQRRRGPSNIAEHSRLVLRLEPENDNSGVLFRRVGADVAEIEIERD